MLSAPRHYRHGDKGQDFDPDLGQNVLDDVLENLLEDLYDDMHANEVRLRLRTHLQRDSDCYPATHELPVRTNALDQARESQHPSHRHRYG